MELIPVKTIRTNNFTDKHVMQKISDLWKRAAVKLSEYEGVIYGLYHEYDSDYRDDYSLSVAIEGENGISIKITEETIFEVFQVDSGLEEGIVHTWNKIWELEKAGKLRRSYTYDYEKYYPNGKIEIYVAVKK